MKKEEFSLSTQTSLALRILRDTGANLFLTGKAGTGKTTFLRQLKERCPKRMIVVAPTGVAAMNAGGVTIHSFFQLPFGPYLPGRQAEGDARKFYKFSKEKTQIIRSLDLLVIDEISMVRADLLDAVSDVLKRHRRSPKPFGGVQLLLIGDLQQLAPVVKDEEWGLLQSQYASPFFFDSRDLASIPYWQIELTTVYRQSDSAFVDLLNHVRENRLDAETLRLLNSRYIPNFQPADADGYITLTTHNYMAQQINNRHLDKLPTRAFTFDAEIQGDFPAYNFPTEEHLVLKQGAQVMFVKNDSSGERRYYNGKIGHVASITSDRLTVIDSDGTEILVERETWTNTKYTLNTETQAIEESTAGTFCQYPLKLAWAITIHKSQGLTFDRAIIDAAAAFSHGQVYVALSRCRTLEGMVLTSPLSAQTLIRDTRVEQFTDSIPEHQPNDNQLAIAQKNYYRQLLVELFDFTDLQQAVEQTERKANQYLRLLYPNFASLTTTNRRLLYDQVTEVGSRFQKQLNGMIGKSLDYQHDKAIQERVQKGCPYFLEKLTELCLPLLQISHQNLDNKEAKLQINRTDDRLREELRRKLFVLKASQNGFSPEAYLAAKAKAAIDEPEEKKERARSPRKREGVEKIEVSEDILHQDLYDRLRAWRWREAQAKNLPAYTILQQKAMLGIANTVPTDERTLLAIPGIGRRVVENYGESLLNIVSEWKKTADA